MKATDGVTRRHFLRSAAVGSGMAVLGGLDAFGGSKDSGGVVFSGRGKAQGKKVLILGIDGMDPGLLRQYVDAGLMPNFKRLIEQGDFKPLQTTMPPQSPVAWSAFITGMDPGGHGIFDFVHRDPKTMEPFLSMSKANPPEKVFNIGSWSIPLRGGKVEQLRKGRAFWQMLDDHGIPATVVRIPANFPPAPFSGRSLSGMGTPDILGTSGMFSYYTSRLPDNAASITGGTVYQVEVKDGRVDAHLDGPRNQFQRVPKEPKTSPGQGSDPKPVEYENPEMKIDFTVFVDPVNPVAEIVVQDKELVLKEGEWSDWVEAKFETGPVFPSISVTCRFFLKQVRPDFKLYVTPLQIDPRNPAMPISTPKNWSRDLSEAVGFFYTQELPEEPKALRGGVLSGREFWDHAQFILREQQRALDYCLEDFRRRGGTLFFYFSSLDQGSHMLWRYVDEQHPAYDPSEKLQDSLATLYREMDETLGKAMQFVDGDTTLIVMSDHGFSPFYWGVNLNSWLVTKGYVRLLNPAQQERYKVYMNVDWKHTKAYALGLNGVYVNLKGREKNGAVAPEEYDALLDQLEKDLLELRDPDYGHQPISLVTRTHRDFHGPWVDIGPDLIVGYNWGYRTSWESPLGEFPREIFVENKDAWSADHCMDPRVVPGVLLTNRKIILEKPALHDVTVAVLSQYGIDPLPEMLGKNCIAV